MAKRLLGVADVEECFAKAEVERCPVADGNSLAGEKRLHLPDQRISHDKALEVRLAKQDSRRVREGLRCLLHGLLRLGLSAKLHVEVAQVGDGVHLPGTRQDGGPPIGFERRLECADSLKHLAERIMRLRALWRDQDGALGRFQRLVRTVKILERQRARRERAGVSGAKASSASRTCKAMVG